MRFIGLTLSLFLLVSNVLGQVKINIGYSKQVQKEMSQFDRGYPDFQVGVDYCLTNWCYAGVFVGYGLHRSYVSIVGFIQEDGSQSELVFDGQVGVNYYHYGFGVELHPLSIWFPGFNFVDFYGRGELGGRTVTEKYRPEFTDTNYCEPLRSDFCYRGGLGVAVNPMRHVGIFYELVYDNLNKIYRIEADEYLIKPIHRFGITVRL